MRHVPAISDNLYSEGLTIIMSAYFQLGGLGFTSYVKLGNSSTEGPTSLFRAASLMSQ